MTVAEVSERVKALNYDHHRRMGEDHNSFSEARQQQIVELDDNSMRDLLANLPMVESALELGSASGGQWHVLREKAASVSGIDLYEPAVAQAQAEGKHIVLGFVEAMPFPDESFDLVVSRHVMEHVGSIEEALAEVKRVLKVGGYVAAVTPHYSPDPEPAHINQLKDFEWSERYERAGLTVIECEIRNYNCQEAHIVARRD